MLELEIYIKGLKNSLSNYLNIILCLIVTNKVDLSIIFLLLPRTHF